MGANQEKKEEEEQRRRRQLTRVYLYDANPMMIGRLSAKVQHYYHREMS